MTKIQAILKEREITPTQFQKLLLQKSKSKMGLCRISKLIHGKLTNYTIKTAKAIANSLDVTINDIVD